MSARASSSKRSPGRLLVEQEAVSQFMMFSKKAHLILEVMEDGNVIRFTDQSGKSFLSYEGPWAGGTHGRRHHHHVRALRAPRI
jgi:acetylornithine/succinyldiaminopimelate/putrescine aminotransferase